MRFHILHTKRPESKVGNSQLTLVLNIEELLAPGGGVRDVELMKRRKIQFNQLQENFYCPQKN